MGAERTLFQHVLHVGFPSLRVLCGRPLGFKSESENSDGRIDCDHVSGLLTRHHDRWPRWVPRSSPKQSGDLEGRDSKRVLWIVGSTDRHLIQLFHPGTYARSRVSPAEAREAPRASSWPMPSGPSRWSITTEAPRRFSRLEFGEIEFDNRAQRVGERTVLLVVGQRVQPAGILDL